MGWVTCSEGSGGLGSAAGGEEEIHLDETAEKGQKEYCDLF